MRKILPFIIALGIGAGAFAGLNSFGNANQTPTGETPFGEKTGSKIILTDAQEEAVSKPEQTAVSLPETVESSGETENYGEIIAQEDGLAIYRVQAKRYKGLLAEITDISRLTVGVCGEYFSEAINGKQVGTMADNAGAVLAVNGGGFYDPDGNGGGGLPTGNVFANGKQLYGEYSHTIGLDANGVLHCGAFAAVDCQNMNLQWALSYGPTLVIDGAVQQGLRTELEEPRTAVGQREDGTILIFCIQGRQASALGVTEQQLAYIMHDDLGCVNAGNLDGGASSYMYYRGEYINIANTGGYPRNVPTCLMLMPAEQGATE